MKRAKGLKGVILLIVMAGLIIGYYFHLSNRNVPEKEASEEQEVLTKVQEVLLRDLETSYPPSPKEVVKYFSEITECFYNETYSEEELTELARKIRGLYDDELVAAQSEELYLERLKIDIAEYKKNGWTIVNYTPSSSVDVETFTEDEFEWARLYCDYGVRDNSVVSKVTLKFLLRKDAEGHYRIFGWQQEENGT